MRTILSFFLFLLGKPNSNWSFAHMRRDYIKSKINVINIISNFISIIKPKYKIKYSSGVLGSMSDKEVNKICEIIIRDGCYVFSERISEEIIEEIKEVALTLPFNYLQVTQTGIEYSSDKFSYSEAKEKSIRFEPCDISVLSKSQTILKLIQDQNFLHIANNYLNTKPILDLVLMWWSNSHKKLMLTEEDKLKLKNSAAQMFHFDMDRLKFLKIFVYLTDVNEHNGPHVYVKKTHNNCPNYIKEDGRYSDDLILQKEQKNIYEIIGKAGTVILADTRGLHKGKELEEGERLIFQIEFTNSDFGKPEFQQITQKYENLIDTKYNKVYNKYFKIK